MDRSAAIAALERYVDTEGCGCCEEGGHLEALAELARALGLEVKTTGNEHGYVFDVTIDWPDHG